MNNRRSCLIPFFACLVWAGCQQLSGPSRRGELNLGLQTYTFRELTLAESADKAVALGIRSLQGFPRQRIGGGIEGTLLPTLDEAVRARVLALLAAKGVKLESFGVANGTTDAEWRQLFSFARAMGMRDIAVEPPIASWPTVLPLLDQLARESGVNVTFHNHANPDNPPERLLAALKPYGNHMGLCADTGHWARSGFDPVTALRKAEGRILALHFKDVVEFTRRARDVPWGTGVSNAAGQLAELRRQGFRGTVYLEYESRTPRAQAEIAQCVEYFRRAMSARDTDLIAGRVVAPGFTADVAEVWKKRSQ